MKTYFEILYCFLKFILKSKTNSKAVELTESINITEIPCQIQNNLTDEEVLFFAEKADISLKNHEYEKALLYYDDLITYSYPRPSYYVNRALIYDNLTEFGKSIEDIKTAIKLDPDDPTNYWMLGGYLVSNEMILHGKLTDPSSKQALQNAANNYKISLEKDPTNECAWLDMIEINLLTINWDDAICTFGMCEAYINYLPYKFIRSFLGGIALIMSGEEVDSEDMIYMNNPLIKITNDHYRGCEIESLITELEKTGYEACRIKKAKEYYRLFLSHYEGEMRRYGSHE